MRERLLSHRLRVAWIGAVTAAVLTACTTLPGPEFAAYREAFSQARVAGEKVLLDQSAAQARKTAMDGLSARKEEGNDPENRRPWSSKTVEASAGLVDPIGVRMEAWRIVAQYNDALLALAEGRNAEELGQAVGGLAQGLSQFPWARIGERAAAIAGTVGGAVGPAIELMKTLVVEAKREADRRKFIRAVAAGSPFVLGLIGLLKDDADDFWKFRFGLHDREYAAVVGGIGVNLAAFKSSLAAYGDPGPAVKKPEATPAEQSQYGAALVRARTEKAIRTLREYRKSGLGRLEPGPQPPRYTEPVVAELGVMADDIERLTNEAQGLERQMDAYERVLTEYVLLLLRLEGTLSTLRVAAESSTPHLPPVEDLLTLAIRVRRTIEEYEKAR